MRVLCEFVCVSVEMFNFWTHRDFLFVLVLSAHVGKYYALLRLPLPLPRFAFSFQTSRTHSHTHPWHTMVVRYLCICVFVYSLTHFPQHIDESTAVYLWFEMEPIEAIWWIITCAFDELCNIRHKRSHAERERSSTIALAPARAAAQRWKHLSTFR